MNSASRFRYCLLMPAILLACSLSWSAQTKDEDQVRAAWTKLQAAIKSKDAGKIWDLLDSDTRDDADRAAKKVKAAYKKADAKEKTEHEEGLGLSADELAKLTGTLLLKSKRFHAKYYEIPDSKVTGITVKGDMATL